MNLELKRREKEEEIVRSADSRKAQLTPQRGDHPPSFYKRSSSDEKKRQYREQLDDTPTHGGGVNVNAKSAIQDRHQKLRRVDYATSKDKGRKDYERDRRAFPDQQSGGGGRRFERDNRGRYNRDNRGREIQNRKEDNRPRYYDKERPGQDRDRSDRSNQNNNNSRRRDEPRSERSFRNNSSRREGDSVRFSDGPLTPAFSIANTPSRKQWDDDDSGIASRRSTQWDYPTPLTGDRARREDETPLPTPVHKFNPWVIQPGSSRVMETPWFVKGKEGSEETTGEEFQIDKDEWEDEQKRLDREWYSIDEGYDEVHNPFAGVSEEYTKKKEDQIAQKKNQRMSAQQRQIHRDNELWEKNRMLTSGVVVRVEDDEEEDAEGEARVHLLVNHIIPPFLDGRIVFTKQFEPVIPVKVSQNSLNIYLV
jgi:pre-mRNA-splicing factor ATP-dependent RNA helicase DHX38/PRP16